MKNQRSPIVWMVILLAAICVAGASAQEGWDETSEDWGVENPAPETAAEPTDVNATPEEIPEAPLEDAGEAGEPAASSQEALPEDDSSVSEAVETEAETDWTETEAAATEPETVVSDSETAEPAEGDSTSDLIELTPEEYEDAETLEAGNDNLISITLDNVPLQDVIRMFARISGVNIVSGTNLHGNITVSLKDVEWYPALKTILDTAGMSLVMKSPGIYSVVTKAEAAAAPMAMETIYLHYSTISNILPVVQRMITSSNASAAGIQSANAIVIQETSERIDIIRDVIVRIDKPRPQVFIEAKFVELDDTAIKDLGINWRSLGGDGNGPGGFNLRAGSLTWGVTEERNRLNSRMETLTQFDNRRNFDGINRSHDIDGVESLEPVGPSTPFGGSVGRSMQDTIDRGRDVGLDIVDSFEKTVADARAAILTASDFEVTLSALQQQNGAKVVSNPRIVVASGETAKIHVGRMDPNYVTKQEASAGNQVVTKRELSDDLPFIETGVKVDVRPIVNTESNITVKIVPELSRVIPGGREGDIPPISRRTISSEFNLESGRTVAIGGLTSTDDREQVSKIPLLGDIPIIGKYLFRHTHTRKEQNEVIIFVTVGMANPETIGTSAGIPSGGRLIHRHLAREAMSKGDGLPAKK